ncbi:trypsin-like serine protease [Egibacter rhizosphaerae]|uniref:Trypsin-like serine protease n=1 Tax=Egibacter rhizosphaerae TaxID=1670831 RepID=A0A411YDH9_9ACTN|nr:cell wall-binding repeat-containing protein [Egibacter rhizosphaerae]QBI19226.1 trypsin-like serine protease [Egibacter rhizosphaerae]
MTPMRPVPARPARARLLRGVLVASLVPAIALTSLAGAPAATESDDPETLDIQPRVVGGDEAEADDWPWTVAIVDRGDEAGETPRCAGSYLGDRWVLTAAHCVEDRGTEAAEDLDVRAEVADLRSGGVREPVVDEVVHPGFTGSEALADDVALLRTRERLGVATVPLASPGDWPAWSPGSSVEVAGWGATNPGGDEYPLALHSVQTPVVAPIDCADAFDEAELGDAFDAARTVCTGGVERGTCFGDSGGPLVGADRDGGTVQIGVVSSSVASDEATCGSAPDLYASVPAYLDWIVEKTGLAVEDLTRGDGGLTPARVGGSDGVSTSVALSEHAFAPGPDEVFVATADAFPDGLAGGALAAMHGPLLLVPPTGALPDDVAGELDRLGPESITILGGSAAIADEVEDQLGDWGDVRRLAGADRYATAAEVAGAWHETSTAIVATGEAFPDALSAIPLAAYRGPVLLTRPDSLPDATRSVLGERQPDRVLIVGGSAAVGTGVEQELERLVSNVERVGGEDRYATAAEVATHGDNWQGPPFVYLARGDDFRAALPAGVAASFHASPLGLLPPGEASEGRVSALAEVGAQRPVVVGDGISDGTAERVREALATP